MADTSASSDVSRHKYTVLTGFKKEGGRKGLYIRISDQIHPSDFTCSLYYLSHQGAQQYIMKNEDRAPSPKFVIQELGWFSAPTIFKTIVSNVPIPTVAVAVQQNNNASHEDRVFCAWIDDVLRALDLPQNANNWQRNDGNST
jgi:hypothetical protein